LERDKESERLLLSVMQKKQNFNPIYSANNNNPHTPIVMNNNIIIHSSLPRMHLGLANRKGFKRKKK